MQISVLHRLVQQSQQELAGFVEAVAVHQYLRLMTPRRQSSGRVVERDRSFEQISANAAAAAERPVPQLRHGHPEGLVVAAALGELDPEPGVMLGRGHVAEEVRDRSARPVNAAAKGRVPACIRESPVAQLEAVAPWMGKLGQPQQRFRSLTAGRCIDDRTFE